MRIVASAIIVLAGAICLSFGNKLEGTSAILLVVGGVCFAIEFVRTWTGKD